MSIKAHKIVIVVLSYVLVFSGIKYNELQTNLKNEQRIVRELQTREKEIRRLQAEVKKSQPARGSIPDHSSFKSYMDFRTITDTKSPQYKLQQQASSINGFRMLGDRYMIALGSAFGKVGDHVTVVLENGTSISCIIGDIKANHHTDRSNKVHLSDGSIIEFIVDTRSLSKKIKLTGDCSYAEHINLQGKVKEVIL